MKTGKLKKAGKGIAVYAGVLVVTYLVCWLICLAAGRPFITASGLHSYLKSALYIVLIAWAVSFNVPSGRFDFSVGAVLLLSVIIGGNLAVQWGLGPWGMLALSMACGAVLGGIVGLLYVVLRLPAMVLSLGVALAYEAFTFILFNGAGINLVTHKEYLSIGSQPSIYIIAAIIFALLIVVFNFTRFSYRRRAVIGGQKIAVNTGINERTVAILCYVFCGVLAAVAGLIPLCQSGSASPKLGLSTISTMFTGFLAMFIGQYLAKYGEFVTGVLVGALVNAMISTLFSQLGLSVATQNIINAFILLAFLIFEGNFFKIALKRAVAQKKKELSASSEQ